jgi:glycosyltransferase involved in cell wall biosynthesis
MPVLEALARGVPVACTDLPVLHEVGGEVPRFFSPDDPQGAARAITEAATNPPAGGQEWAAKFTWEAAGAATWQVYDKVLAA